MLKHEKIQVKLKTCFEELREDFLHTFYSGPIDRYFKYDLGRLRYRTLDFEEIRSNDDFLGTAVMNFPDRDVPYTRISEHKFFAPWEKHKFVGSVSYREFSRFCGVEDIPYYPIRLLEDKSALLRYEERAQAEQGVTFVGRLGTYQYLDMDKTIELALAVVNSFIALQTSQN